MKKRIKPDKSLRICTIIDLYKKYLPNKIQITEKLIHFVFYVENKAKYTDLYVFNHELIEGEPALWKHCAFVRRNCVDDMKPISETTFIKNFKKSIEFELIRSTPILSDDEITWIQWAIQSHFGNTLPKEWLRDKETELLQLKNKLSSDIFRNQVKSVLGAEN